MSNKKQILVAPSILSANFMELGKEIKKVEKAGADFIHVDVMDGHFVPNLTMGPQMVKSLKTISDLPLDVHLMITDPQKFVKTFADAGSDYISVHIENKKNALAALKLIKKHKKKAGIVINPDTPVKSILPLLRKIDLVLVMSVFPGFSAQKFIPDVLSKTKELYEYRKKHNLKFLIEMDGGINLENKDMVISAGTDIIVSASAIFKTKNYNTIIKSFKRGA